MSAQLGWSQISEQDKEAAVDRLEQHCVRRDLGWGNPSQRKALARWRVFHLQRAGNMFHRRHLGIGKHGQMRKECPAANLYSNFTVQHTAPIRIRSRCFDSIYSFRRSDKDPRELCGADW